MAPEPLFPTLGQKSHIWKPNQVLIFLTLKHMVNEDVCATAAFSLSWHSNCKCRIQTKLLWLLIFFPFLIEILIQLFGIDFNSSASSYQIISCFLAKSLASIFWFSLLLSPFLSFKAFLPWKRIFSHYEITLCNFS